MEATIVGVFWKKRGNPRVFNGQLLFHPNALSFVGETKDDYGIAEIISEKFTPTELIFTKKYKEPHSGIKGEIRYHFTAKNWRGVPCGWYGVWITNNAEGTNGEAACALIVN